MRNRYLERKMSRMRDGRNPYGSRGGYVDSRRGGYGRDRAMDSRDYRSEYDSRGYDRAMSDHRGQDYHMVNQYNREPYRRANYEMQGYVTGRSDYRGDYNDYARTQGGYGYDHTGDYRDYRGDYNDYDYADYGNMDKQYKDDLEKWMHELKQHDRFGMPKDQIMQKANQMGIKFDQYDETEFLTTYYMVISDNPQIANDPHTYLAMAKNWLEDKDAELKGSEKLCAYYYEIVKGGKQQQQN